jgi:transcriptional regulator with XRE-family HTH domain
MPSKLGQLIRTTRTKQEISLREFARRIEKSPAFVTQLECDDEIPAVAEETLRTVAKELRIDPGTLFVLAQRTPRDLVPRTETEYALYRKVKTLSVAEQRALLERLSSKGGE